MRWGRATGGNDGRKKKDLERRLEAIERDAAEAREKGDALAEAIAYNNLGTTQADLKAYEPALTAYLKAAELCPADATLDEQITPWGNAAAVARQLDRWDAATLYSVRVDALASQAADDQQMQVATVMLALIRKRFGKDAFAPLLDTAIAELPEALRPHVRRDFHADPTFRADAAKPDA